MSDEATGTEDGVADPENHLTAEDAGSTTDPADLVDDGAPGPSEGDDDTPRDALPGTGLAGVSGDEAIGHVFDQTNGVVDGLDGDSDGTAESDVLSSGERDLEDQTIADDDVRTDDDGVHDLNDPNP